MIFGIKFPILAWRISVTSPKVAYSLVGWADHLIKVTSCLSVGEREKEWRVFIFFSSFSFVGNQTLICQVMAIDILFLHGKIGRETWIVCRFWKMGKEYSASPKLWRAQIWSAGIECGLPNSTQKDQSDGLQVCLMAYGARSFQIVYMLAILIVSLA